MIVRMVKLTFKEDKISDFLFIFEATKHKIRAFEGCKHLELLQDANHPNVFFTYSHWQNQEHLNKYRNSALFGEIWPKTKRLFSAKPEAWSTVQKEILI